MASPGLGDWRVFLAPWAFGEGVQFFLPGGGVLGPVDLLQRRRDSLAVLVGNEVQRIADQVNDAGLNLGLRKHRGDCVRKTFQAMAQVIFTALDHSILELAKAFENASGRSNTSPDRAAPRGHTQLASKVLGWAGCRTICEDAWRWQSNDHSGYADRTG
jgi:hypothetical protein